MEETAVSNQVSPTELDVIVIGAGFGGMYSLHLLREMGLKAKVYDAADGVGGVWRWNGYPGARVDFPGGPYYCYTFSEELVKGWNWAESQPDQKDVLAYMDYVADQLDLRRDIQLDTWVTDARFNETTQRWVIETDQGETVSAQFMICAVGTLSAAHKPDIPGFDDFAGECYHTGGWPNEGVDFAGKRVGVIGTGSSGVQSIPIIAREADQLTVFQRTPQYTIPAKNHPLDEAFINHTQQNWPEIRDQMIASPFGAPIVPGEHSALEYTEDERNAVYEELWQKGGFAVAFNSYSDILTNKEANFSLAEFVRSKIRATVKDPVTAEKLLPDYYIGTKRLILDTGYHETYNRDNVTLVDLKADPIERITASGVRTASGDEYPLDILILATGYDAVTGAMQRLNPKGRNGISLNEEWADRFNTYLGMTIPQFPNLFMIHGPETPSVLYNMPLGAELEAEWIRDCIGHLREESLGTIEPAKGVEKGWGDEVLEIANETLFPLTDSWYTGANIPGKHRQFAVHLGGPLFFQRLTEVAENDYEGFVLQE
ncbi:MAG: cyclohexanone monooxygenase [Gammaproteobacteria bacterium]|nr:MAG: cyclohexanone monooxygenase [Gammaproteobacteria bacterium]RLA17404.1 MAG: cyclohexanone monooxygenase [Gammaproteobacteria bacterium]